MSEPLVGPEAGVRASERVDQIIDEAVPLLARMREALVAKLHAHGLSLTAHQVTDRMVERGLVERLRDANDRRVVLLCLSPEGRRLVREFHSVRRAQMRRLLNRLDGEQQQRLLHTVRDIRDVVASSTARTPRSQRPS